MSYMATKTQSSQISKLKVFFFLSSAQKKSFKNQNKQKRLVGGGTRKY